MKGGEADHQAGTITGTRNVLDSSLKHHVKKLVHISSLSVVEWAGAPDNAVISESSPLEPRAGERGHYTRSKLQAELLVKSYSQEKGLPSVILRPGQIFGGSIPLMTPAVARRRGEGWIVLGDGEMRLPLVYIDDVVDAVMAAARSQLMHGEVIQLVDPEQFTQNQVIEMALGKEASVKHVPLPVLLTLGGMSELMLRPLKRPSPLSRYRLHSALSRRRFVNENTGLLGWSPRVGVREGIRRAMDKKPSTTDMAEMKGIKPTPRANVPAAAHA
jgi:nucleoside-diphosphate-sugar epimerase